MKPRVKSIRGFEKWKKGAGSTQRLEMGGQIGVGLELRGLGFLP